MKIESSPVNSTERSRLTRFFDALTGANVARPKILSLIDEESAKGMSEITDKQIKRKLSQRPGDLRITEPGINRALDNMIADGTLTGRRLSAEEANKQNSNYGNNYSRR